MPDPFSRLDATGQAYQTVADAAWVAGKIELSRRRESLGWSHHKEVAALEAPDQDRWLDWAEATTPPRSRNELRAAIKQEKLLRLQSAAAAGQTSQAVIMKQDARRFLEALEPLSVDLLLTDPPYATDVEDIETFAAEWLPLALSRLKPTGRAYVFTGAYPDELDAYLGVLAELGLKARSQVLVWTYRNTLGPAPAQTYKLNWQACFYVRGPDTAPLSCPLMTEQFSVFDVAAPDGRHADGRLHKWQKPDALAEMLVRHSTIPEALVVDPFAGTGTFLSAAMRLGRSARGADTDADMVKLCVERGCVRG